MKIVYRGKNLCTQMILSNNMRIAEMFTSLSSEVRVEYQVSNCYIFHALMKKILTLKKHIYKLIYGDRERVAAYAYTTKRFIK